jgi:hypothetical protein
MRLRKLEGLPNILKLKEEGIILGSIAGNPKKCGPGSIHKKIKVRDFGFLKTVSVIEESSLGVKMANFIPTVT